jgi:pentatricopeptide repeat protein
LMLHHGTEPTSVTIDALFGVLCTLPEAFNFIREVYQSRFFPTKCSPSHITLRYLLEIYMNQAPTKEVISEGNKLFDQLLEFKPTKSNDPLFWDPVVKWMLFRGDSLRVIKHTLYEQNAALGRNLLTQPDDNHSSALIRTAPDDRYSSAVASTLDHLIDVALRIDNENAANTIYEEFFPAFDITPTVSTDELRLETLIRTKQAAAAKSLYDDLQFQGHRLPSNTILRLIQTLACGDHPLPLEVQSVFFDLLDDQECPPETYTASFSILTTLLLRTGDYPRMRQTLQDRQIDRVANWRNTLSNIGLDVISDPNNVWLEPLLPVYHILQRWAPNSISASHRHMLMQRLISHGRTDLGLELFHDMRHSYVSQPTRETYAIMLSGCAKTRDAQTLEHIHNALRLDSSIEPDSALFNSLMFAYNRCRLPEKALAIWEVLSQSSRLPDVNTASLALDACVRLPRYGLIRAREIWTFMEDNHIEPVASSYAALLSVFASVGKWDGMMGLLERMDRNKVDARVLGTAYNRMRRDRKEEVELWAKTNKPAVWEYLRQLN